MNPDKQQLVDALEAAADEVQAQDDTQHRAMATAGAMPSWLTAIMQALGPALLKLLQQWLNNQHPENVPGVPKG